MHNHETIKCKQGNHIVAQCRCIEGSKNIRYIECCDECFKKPIIDNQTNNRIREEFIKEYFQLFEHTVPFEVDDFSKTETQNKILNEQAVKRAISRAEIVANYWLSKIDELLKSQREDYIKNVGMLRQWLNEDRIDDPNKMVTNEELLSWLIKE